MHNEMLLNTIRKGVLIMRKMIKIFLILGVMLVILLSTVSCKKKTECLYCGKIAYCNEVGVDGEAEMLCSECEAKYHR